MNSEDPKSGDQPESAPNRDIDEFFERLPGNLHWPPPSEAAIAAAVEVVQRMAGAQLRAWDEEESRNGATSGRCAGCGQTLGDGVRFCGNCGLPVAENNGSGDVVEGRDPERKGEFGSEALPSQARPPAVGGRVEQHHYHHHYHHFVRAAESVSPPAQSEAPPRGKAAAGSAPGSRAEVTAKQVAQDWAQSCNIKHLDDLVDLYMPDATMIRPNVLPIRSAPSIREFLFAALEAGLGDVEMSSLRTEVFGEIALDVGRCKMLVPVAMGKRREERGKYVLVMARQPAGHWKIIADCWSTDLSVGGVPATETAKKGTEAAVRKPR